MRLHKGLLSILLIWILAGCSTAGNEALQTIPADWPPIGTTKAQVLERLGEPQSKTVMVDARGIEVETWGYSYAHAEASPWLWVPIVGLGIAASGEGITGEGKGLILSFDKAGRVQSRSTNITPIGQRKRPTQDPQTLNPDL